MIKFAAIIPIMEVEDMKQRKRHSYKSWIVLAAGALLFGSLSLPVNSAKADAAKADTAKADTAKADTARADTGKTNTTKADNANTITAIRIQNQPTDEMFEPTGGVAPFIDSAGRVQVPMSMMAKATGSQVKWDAKTKSAVFTTPEGKQAVFTVGSNSYTSDGVSYPMDTAPVNKNGSIYAPAKFVADGVGMSVIWVKEWKRLDLYYGNGREVLLRNGPAMTVKPLRLNGETKDEEQYGDVQNLALQLYRLNAEYHLEDKREEAIAKFEAFVDKYAGAKRADEIKRHFKERTSDPEWDALTDAEVKQWVGKFSPLSGGDLPALLSHYWTADGKNGIRMVYRYNQEDVIGDDDPIGKRWLGKFIMTFDWMPTDKPGEYELDYIWFYGYNDELLKIKDGIQTEPF